MEDNQRVEEDVQTLPRSNRSGVRNVIICTVIAILAVATLLVFLLPQKSTYQRICSDGYGGTQEQWIASLVGEEMDPDGETAYDLAVKNGYRKTETEWMQALTGAAADGSQTPYQTACTNGYQGSLVQWLTQIARNPDDLGKSSGETATDYEYACMYGFTGTFIEWLVSLSGEQIG